LKKEKIVEEKNLFVKKEKKKNYKTIQDVKSWKFWYMMSDICDENMDMVMEKMKGLQDVEACWKVLREGIVEVLEVGRRKVKHKKREYEGEELKAMNKEIEKLKKKKRGTHEHTQYKTLKNRIQKLRKKIRKVRMREKIEAVIASRGKEYWDMLKRLGGWGKKGSRIPATVLDEKGIEREGEERLTVWREAFRQLGVDDIDDPDFDRDFALSVEAEVKEMEEKSEMKEDVVNESDEELKEKDDDDEETRKEKRQKREEKSRQKLNTKITEEEVNRAINLIQNHKAPGQDGVIGEILKTGGEKIRKAVWMLCCVAWNTERVPKDWVQGVVFPLYKDGDDRDPLNYRGITLLSIVGKVYNRVLATRLMKFGEREGLGIVEEQGGFRPERGTEDQIFIFTEVLRARTQRTTYTAFIDMQKAYDRVWRNGLWKRMWDEGVRGKIWRVIKNMYSVVQSSVLVGVEKTDTFDLHTGVRQGCVMSPVLFSFFINGLAREINEKTQGVSVGDISLRLLLYADDVVLLAGMSRDLQDMLDVVTSYCRKWRFRVNPKKGKSEVMLFGRKPRSKEARKWRLAGVEIQETESYTYLGVELVSRLNFKKLKERCVANARKRMMLVWAMGMRRGELPVADCCRVWNALVRPVLEYGAVIWGEVKWDEAEAVQREMGKMILRCSSKMANEVVLGELGWWTLKARRDLLRVKFWGKIVSRMSSSRLVKQVYAHSRARYDAEQPSQWCTYTHALLADLGMEEAWQQGTLDLDEKKWNKEIREKIHAREEKEWIERMNTKPKLRTYILLKNELSFETYLAHDDRQAREVMTRLRGGTNELRIEIGRYPNTNRDRRLEVHERRCLLCMSGEIEDEKHFVMQCGVYDDLRKKLFVEVKRVMLKKNEEIEDVMKTEAGRQGIFEAVLTGKGVDDCELQADLRRVALEYCRAAMRRRNYTVVTYLDQRT
jgi:hypothetical protein